MTEHSFDWLRFVVRFFFGALLGMALGFGFWARLSDGDASGWLPILSAACVVGLAAAYWGDDFWLSLRNWLFWWV